jgi:hypothetical protein
MRGGIGQRNEASTGMRCQDRLAIAPSAQCRRQIGDMRLNTVVTVGGAVAVAMPA